MEPMLLWGLGLLAAAVLLLLLDIFLPSGGMLSMTSLVTAISVLRPSAMAVVALRATLAISRSRFRTPASRV